MPARPCQCETPIIDWESPYCDGTCRRCAGDLGHTLTDSRDDVRAAEERIRADMYARLENLVHEAHALVVEIELASARIEGLS